MTNGTNNIGADISVNGQKIEEATSFEHLGESLCMDGTCSANTCIRIATAMSAVARLNRIWRCNTISFKNKFKLYKSLVTSILLNGCETWTLLADSQKGSASPTWSNNQRLGAEQDRIPCGSTGTSSGNGQETETLWFGHVTLHDSLSKTILQGTLYGRRRCGRQRKCWMDIKE